MTVDDRFDWDEALFELMYEGWTKNLSDLLKTDRPIPPGVRHYLAGLLEGEAKLPDGRGKKNTALSPADREAIRAALFELYWRTETVLVFADELADERGEEVIDLRRYIEGARREGLKKIGEKFGISANTVRQYHDAKDTAAFVQCHVGVRDMQNSEGKIIKGLFGNPDVLKAAALSRARDYLLNPELFF